MKIATFTDHSFSPSSRFRVRQYFPYLIDNGIVIHDYSRKYSTETASSRNGNRRIRESGLLISKALIHESANVVNRFIDSIRSNNHDAIWLSRQLIIGYPSFEFLIRKPIIYDIDDAIYLSSKLANLQFRISARNATAVIAGNEFLAEEASKYSNSVHVVPTAVDTLRWKPRDNRMSNASNNTSEHFLVGWSGTSSSFKYFLPIEQDIENFIRDYPSAKLIFMSNRFPHELQRLRPYIQYIEWNANDEVEFVQSLDVGLMPIADDMWSRGKCAYKSLLYAACGIPVVMSPVGVNSKLLEQADIGFGPKLSSEWYDALLSLYLDRTSASNKGRNGVALVERLYSLKACAPLIMNILSKCA